MKKRLFVAINLPDSVKMEIIKQQAYLSELPFRWTKKDSLHITLCFLGWVQEDKINEIREILENTSRNHDAFEIKLDSLSFGPSDFMPRMIWVNGDVPEELMKLQSEISELLKKYCNIEESREYKLHITIGRIVDKKKIKDLKPIRPPGRQVKQKLDIKFKADSFELMESKLSRERAEYEVIKSYKLITR